MAKKTKQPFITAKELSKLTYNSEISLGRNISNGPIRAVGRFDMGRLLEHLNRRYLERAKNNEEN